MWLSSLSLILFASLFVLIPQAYAQQSCDYGSNFAMYFDSGTSTSLSPGWQAVYDAAVAHPCVSIIITSNPDNGVGNVFETDTAFAIPKMQEVGIKVCGYVSTDWNNFGGKTEAEVKAEMDQWVAFYPTIDCFFFDEMENQVEVGLNGDSVEYYTRLTDYAKNNLGVSQTRGNPGTDIDEAYKNSVDNIKVGERQTLFDLSSLFNDWKVNEPVTLFTLTPHTISDSVQAVEDWVIESNQYVSHVYVQSDGGDGNPWDSLSVYFEQVVILQEAANLNGLPPPPPSGTNVTGCQTLDQIGVTYTQVNNIVTTQECITITANGITYNGNGFTITGDASGNLGDDTGDTGIHVIGVTGVTITDVDVSFFRFGIYLNGASGNTVQNSFIHNINKYGVQLHNGAIGNLITGNAFFLSQNGVHMWPGVNDGNTITLNTFQNSNHEQVHIHNNNHNNDIFNNNFLDLTGPDFHDECIGCGNFFHENWYDRYDTPAEGCTDSNGDGFCDAPMFGNGNQDNSAHTTQNAWLNGTPPPPPPPPDPTGDPTTPILESAILFDASYMLDWTLPFTTLGTPDGGYDVLIDGVDTNDQWRTTNTDQTINGLDTGLTHCFEIQARWTQVNFLPISNELCVDPDVTPPPPPPPNGDLELRVAALEAKDTEQDARLGVLEQLWNDLVNFFSLIDPF